MQGIIELIRQSFSQEFALILISMLPIVELKGAIPIGFLMGIDPFKIYVLSYIGSILPILPILLWLKPFFKWIRGKNKKLSYFIDHLKQKAKKKDKNIVKHGYLGLFIFVAIPLPGTGIWTGSLIASLLGLNIRKSFFTIAGANAVAGILIHTFSGFFF